LNKELSFSTSRTNQICQKVFESSIHPPLELGLNFILHISTVKNFGNCYVLLFYGLEILSKNFRKSWNIFLKKYRHLKSKILHKFHRLVVCVFLPFLTSLFFSHFTYPNLSKNSKRFCGSLLYGV